MSLKDFYSILTHVSIASVLVPITFCVLKRKALNLSLMALFIYLPVCLLSDLFGLYFHDRDEIQDLIRNLFTVVECTLICFIYFVEFIRTSSKFLVGSCFVIFLFFAFRNFLYRDMLAMTDTLVSSLEAVLIILFSSIYLVKFLISSDIRSLENFYFFWIVLGNLCYFGTALIFFLSSDFIKKVPEDTSDFIWGIHDLINIGTNTLFTIGICKAQRR